MEERERKPTTIDEYLAGVPEETIGWQMPMFKYQGMLVGFAAFQEHCSFFPMSAVLVEAHMDELAAYDTSKGTIRLKPGKPLPAALVKKLVKERIKENEAKAATRKQVNRHGKKQE
jgi:uncharacterized protein YdhG (YjbR/CyaY superfamily)